MRGYSTSTRQYISSGPKSVGSGELPIPFNIPSVLTNLLFEDIGLEFDRKQKDMLETLQFSYKAVQKMQVRYNKQDQDLKIKIVADPDNQELKDEFEEMQLDILEANFHFKDLVITMSELLEREQYEKLLKFSNIPV